DWMFDTPPSDRLNEMSTKYTSQVHINPLTAVWYYAMNVRIPPFNNLKARQAVNYATDHDALVKIYGGPKLASPTCQILPPNIPEYCVKSTQGKIDQALNTQLTNQTKANQQWAAVDKILVNQAVWVPMFNPKYLDFVSKRVTGYQFSPQWYMLLDQASVAS